MSRIRSVLTSYVFNNGGNVMTRYAIWVTVSALAISFISLTSADFIVGIVEEDAQIERANLEAQQTLDETGNYETADIPLTPAGMQQQERPVLLPFLRRLAD